MRWVGGWLLLMSCSVPVQDWGPVMGQARCEREQRCGRLSTSVNCKRPEVWSESFPEQAELEANQVGYSGSAAAACVELLRAESCNADVFNQPSCRETFPGRLPEGAPCGVPSVDACGPGLICLGGSPRGCGSCVTATSQGKEPSVTHPCAWGLTPVWDGGLGSSCEPRGALGESCAGRSCLEWLRCVDRLTANPVCRQPPPRFQTDPPDAGALGQACVILIYGEFCLAGLTCLDGGCVALGGYGAPCTTSFECVSGHCLDGACAAPLPRGASCGEAACAPGLFCGAEGVCIAPFCP